MSNDKGGYSHIIDNAAEVSQPNPWAQPPIDAYNATLPSTHDSISNAPITSTDLNFYTGPSTTGSQLPNVAWPQPATVPSAPPPPPPPISPFQPFHSPFPVLPTTTATTNATTPEQVPRNQVAPTRAFWTTQFWQQFFNVDSEDVKCRILCSILPGKQEPEYLEEKKYSYKAYYTTPESNQQFTQSGAQAKNTEPDLYGPLWICATLWVIIAVVAWATQSFNCSRHKDLTECKNSWFTPVVVACSVIFGYQVIVPFSLWLLMKYNDVSVTFVETLCLYGYSLFVFIPISIVCIIPVKAIQWLAVSIGCILSTTNIVWNLYGARKKTMFSQWFMGTLLLVVIAHFGLCAAFKMEFFTSIQ